MKKFKKKLKNIDLSSVNFLILSEFCTMENQFTFIQSPELTALKHALKLMPGLQQVDVIRRDMASGELVVNRLREKEDLSFIALTKETRKDTEHFYLNQNGLAWFQMDEVPYNLLDKPSVNNDLFTELDKNILSIPFKAMTQLTAPIYLFYFRKNASELGPVSSTSVLDTSHKQLLGRLISNSMKALLIQLSDNRMVMMDYNRRISGILKSKEQKIEDLSHQKHRYQSYLEEVLNSILAELKDSNEQIVLANETKELLFARLQNPQLVKNQLKSALIFARTFYFNQASSIIELLPEYFDLHEEEVMKTNAPVDNHVEPDLYSSHTKSYQFLDSLEEAAQRLMQNGLKLTSMNVGKELHQPVTAAAISDKLKNHAYKIHLLLKQYPGKWPIIRNQFRPVINIQEKQLGQKYAS